MRLHRFAASAVASAVARTIPGSILGILLAVSLFGAAQTGAQTSLQPAYTAVALNPAGSIGSAGLSAAGGKQTGYAEISGVTRAVTWSGTAASLVVLEQPAGAEWSAAYAASGAIQVGGAGPTWARHAILWSQNGPRDLHPSGFSHSLALGTSGSRHVGWVYDAAIGQHALLWEETPLGIVPVDLHPPGVSFSWATATSGEEHVGAVGFEPLVHPEDPPYPSYEPWFWQIGWIVGDGMTWLERMTSTDSPAHAALWQGRSAAAIDLNPEGYRFSVATGVSGGQQVGYGLSPDSYYDWNYHAVRWAGTPESAVDLHPPGFYASQALGTNGSRQVGWGYSSSGGGVHALVWSEDVALDLHPFLPPGCDYSVATGIDIEGNVTGYAVGRDGQRAFLWKPGAGATPSPVLSLTATPEGKGIRLTWQPPASSGSSAVTGYRIYRRDWSYDVVHLASVGATTTSFKNVGLTSGGTYVYQVSAVNAAGEGAQGSRVSAVAP